MLKFPLRITRAPVRVCYLKLLADFDTFGDLGDINLDRHSAGSFALDEIFIADKMKEYQHGEQFHFNIG